MTIAREVAAYVTANPLVIAAAAVAALTAVLAVRRLLRGRQPEDLMTVLAALLAQVVVMTGMWRFAGNVLHFSGAERVSLFAFLEIAVVACAFRARRNMKKFNTAGVEGIAVWVLSALSGVFAALDATSFTEALFRLSAPLVAAWLWHRAMQLERRERTGRTTHWKLTAERILVWLRLAEPAERTASEVDAHRRIAQLTRRAKKLRVLRAAGAKPWQQRFALRRLDKALEGAVEHAALAADPARQDQMLAQFGALMGAEALAALDITPPWTRPEPEIVPAQSHVELFDQMRGTITPGLAPAPAPVPVHHEPPPPAPVPAGPPAEPDITAEADALFGNEPAPVPVPEPAAPKPPARTAPKPPAARAGRATRAELLAQRTAGLPVPREVTGTWTPEAAGLSAGDIARIIEALPRNDLADFLTVSRGAASRIRDTYGQPALAGAGR